MLSQWNKRKKLHKLFFHTFFGASKTWNLSEIPQRSVEIKIDIFISINYFRMLGTGQVNKVFTSRIFINIKNMVTNMKLSFKNVRFRHNSACIIQKWFRFKRVVIVKSGYISLIFPNGSNIISYCFLSLAYLLIP